MKYRGQDIEVRGNVIDPCSNEKAKDAEFDALLLDWVRVGAVEVSLGGRVLSYAEYAALTPEERADTMVRRIEAVDSDADL